MTLTDQDLANLFDASGIGCAVTPCDDVYTPPLSDWVTREFSETLRGNLNALALRYANNFWDCDKFGWLAKAIAEVEWARTAGRPETGLAFGLFFYERDPDRSGHCINVFVNERKEVCFYEPQTQSVVTLSESERQSAWLLVL